MFLRLKRSMEKLETKENQTEQQLDQFEEKVEINSINNLTVT
jgi:hypothetical protein